MSPEWMCCEGLTCCLTRLCKNLSPNFCRNRLPCKNLTVMILLSSEQNWLKQMNTGCCAWPQRALVYALVRNFIIYLEMSSTWHTAEDPESRCWKDHYEDQRYRGVWALKAKLWLTVEALRSSLQVCSLLILSLKCFVNWLRCSQKNWQMQQKTGCKALWRKFISGYITLNFCRSSQSEA